MEIFPQFTELPADLRFFQLISSIPAATLYNLCSTNKQYLNACQSWAWAYVIERDFLGRTGLPTPNTSFYQGIYGPNLYAAIRDSPDFLSLPMEQRRQIIYREAQWLMRNEWLISRLEEIAPMEPSSLSGFENSDEYALELNFNNNKGYKMLLTSYISERPSQKEYLQLNLSIGEDSGTGITISFRILSNRLTDKDLYAMLTLASYYSYISPKDYLQPNYLQNSSVYRVIVTPLGIFPGFDRFTEDLVDNKTLFIDDPEHESVYDQAPLRVVFDF